MPSLKAIRKRISSVKNTQKITKAMKMMAAARLRRAQDSVFAIRPYARRMKKVAEDLAAQVDDDLSFAEADTEQTEGEAGRALQPILLLRGQKEARIRVVAVTSDRGLAGAFSSNVCRRAERFVVERRGAEIGLDVMGRKGRDILRRRGVKIVSDSPGPDAKTAARLAQEMAARLSLAIERGEADAVYVIYNEFKNAGSQVVRVERLLPLSAPPAPPAPGTEAAADDAPRTFVDFIYEPGKQDVLRHLVPLYIETELHRVLLESIASEFGARMAAMDNASRNAKEMISRLTLQYNRARQAAITKELMEIVGGAEALKG